MLTKDQKTRLMAGGLSLLALVAVIVMAVIWWMDGAPFGGV